MATRDNPRTSAARRAASKTSSGPAAASGGAKAQAEFQQYKARMAAAGPGQGQGPGHAPVSGQGQGGTPVYMVPVGFPPGGYPQGGSMPGWAIPPSLASLTQNIGGAGNLASAMVVPGVAAAGSLAERLWSSVGLGLDLLNTALAGSARMLGGMYGGDMYGGGHGHYDHGCGCGCSSSCCNDDCCGCNPSVGRCC